MQETLIAPCGMNCALCISYQAMKNDLNQQGFKRRYCPGCRPRGKNCTFMASQCDLVGKGRVRYCFECDDYPCARLRALDKRYRGKYHMSMLDNLESIRRDGIASFLAEQETAWRCPECGGVICCHNGLCLQCKLDVLRQRRGYHWDDV